MNLYLLFKSLHLIAVISWLAGLLYLPRIFVYHAEAAHESQKDIFKIMEKKLYNYIMMPAMILSWLFGLLLIHSLGFSIFLELCHILIPQRTFQYQDLFGNILGVFFAIANT